MKIGFIIFENIHPEDKARFAGHEQKVTEFFNQIPPEKVLKYKVSYDYRLRCKDGSYKWILMQTITIQSDENGSVIRVLGVHTDITHLKTENKPSGLSFLGLNGEPSFYNVDTEKTETIFLPSEEIFSPREKEILKLIINGKTTKEIAEILYKSKHTINSHRKNILKKSEVKIVTQLIIKSIQNNWFYLVCFLNLSLETA
ncbi:MAG: LuxR C-terminal-related transcriptional regulator [Chitinophagaceae bacterium]